MQIVNKFAKKNLAASIVSLVLLAATSPVHTTAAPATAVPRPSAAGFSRSCIVSSGGWINNNLAVMETHRFRVTYEATPSSSNIDAVTGLSSGPATQFNNLAAIVRFNDQGAIDARNGATYAAASDIRYFAGVTYHFILDINVASHTYSAYVLLGTVQATIASNFAFRSEQANVASLGNLAEMTSTGSHTVCNVAVTNLVAPTLSAQPVSQTITAGQSATFSVVAAGTSPMTYQWSKNGAAITGATSSSYTTLATTAADNSAQITVRVSNGIGEATSSSATLTVKGALVAPTITMQPVAQSVTAGHSATFSVATTGTAPMNYQWNRYGSPIPGATSSSYGLALTAATDNGAQFNVVVSNAAGSVTSNNAALAITAAPLPAGCSTSSATWNNIALGQNQTGSFRVSFNATPSASSINGITGLSTGYANAYTSLAAGIRFNPNGTIDARNGGVFSASSAIPYSAGTSYRLTLDVNVAKHTYNAYVMLGGIQTTVASNLAFRTEQANVTALNTLGFMTASGGHTVCSVALYAQPATAPAITSQPAGVTVPVAQAATFSVNATGSATLTYQWRKNGVAINGATSSTYTSPATLSADSGAQFSVVVTNAAGSVTSNSAALTIAPASAMLLNSSVGSLNFGRVSVSTSSVQNIVLTNTGSANVTISQVSVAGAGFNVTGANGLTLGPGQSTSIAATFAPASNGGAIGNLTVTSNATNSPARITLAGIGAAPASHSVNLSWAASNSLVVGYHTYSSTVSGGPFVRMTSAPQAALIYTDTTVQSGRTYYYVVTAVDASNQESGYSSPVTAVIP